MTKLALVTGGSRGIGKCVVDLLRGGGWDVFAPTRQDLDFSVPGSVSSLESQWIDSQRIPKFDALIFCHGEWFSKYHGERLVSDWDYQYASRVVWPFEFMEFLLGGSPDLRPKSVVFVSSTRGFIGGVNTAPYSAACAAQIALMQGYAREYNGVRFNCVCPSLTATDMGEQVRKTGGCKPDAIAQPPGIVAETIIKLIEGDYNGKVIRVSNGIAEEASWSYNAF